MARHHVEEDDRQVVEEGRNVGLEGRNVGLVDETTTQDASVTNVLARVLGLAAAAVPTIVGLLAVADIDWSGNGFDAPAVSVAGISFTPVVAIAVLAAGLIGLFAAAVRDRGSKLIVGAVYACIGVVILLSNPSVQDVALSDRLGWMAVLVGAVLIVSGLFAVQRTIVRREVRPTVG